MKIATVATGVLAVLAIAVPAASADPGQVTHQCLSFEPHEPGEGNDRQGVQIVVNGNDRLVHEHDVVGPCKTAA
jgi:hypothetical protein